MKTMQVKVVAPLVCAFFAGMPVATVAFAKSHTPAHQSVPPVREAQAIPGIANETPEARQLAFARWEFVKRLGREINFSIWSYTFGQYTALFPIGKSDQVYLLCIGSGDATNGPGDEILCYQRKNGRDKLVYKLPLLYVLTPPTKNYPPKSLLEYITDHDAGASFLAGNHYINSDGSLTIQNQISTYEYEDLSTQRDYVEYKDDWPNDCLDIYLLSDIDSDGFPSKQVEFGFEQDPVTNAKIDQGQFYKKYGLPVIKREEAVIAGAKAPSE